MEQSQLLLSYEVKKGGRRERDEKLYAERLLHRETTGEGDSSGPHTESFHSCVLGFRMIPPN